ncbi:class I SAM-dependent methyltransferase [Pseudolysinimonas yzui]|uniref:Ubiquinone/menaquinone biosynthesis methyltransferase n=1 Tax=Pseudolysinimonas yzui TaxID=2708254 RepID=A0A8J3LXI9_9MICO|nr:class I SAM-dependent methyltransferase [Pseudolysinimonas yzui]GHF05729.1 ubiquinone/menaquinone biosynthesis methyltransferase [Pseudolysinimonas yzui]
MDTDKQTRRQRTVWQKAAARYDRAMAPLERGLLAGSREWIAERAHGRILEVAIGTGRSLEFYPSDVELTGVDLSPAMLRRARHRATELGLKPAFKVADVEHLPYDDGSFDTVVCALGLCSIPRPDAAVREMARVLKPGGTLLLLDHIGSSWPPVWAAQWLIERVTILTSGEHLTRRQLPVVRAAALDVVETERLKAGTIERIRAVKASHGH